MMQESNERSRCTDAQMTEDKRRIAKFEAAKPGYRTQLEKVARKDLLALKAKGYTIGPRIVDTEMCIEYEVTAP
jgi:hypothetical protein